jgi:uncharacterized protein YjiS (DUF1127 family)
MLSNPHLHGGARHSLRRPAGRDLWSTLLLWHQRTRQRRALRLLDAHRLRDIGKSHEDVLGEAEKPFWRA